MYIPSNLPTFTYADVTVVSMGVRVYLALKGTSLITIERQQNLTLDPGSYSRTSILSPINVTVSINLTSRTPMTQPQS